MKHTPLLTFMTALLLALPSLGQNTRTIPVPALGGELPYTEVLNPPMPVKEQMPLAFSTEISSENFLKLGAEVGTAFDDNALLTSSDHTSDVSYIFQPSIEIGQSRPRLRWDLAYRPGLIVNQHVSEQNQAAQNLAFTLDYRLSPHVGVRLREGFVRTNSAFSGLLQSSQIPGSVPVQAPNLSAVTPLADRTSNISAVALTYQFGASSVVGASTNYYFTNYNDSASTTTSLVDSDSVGADGFYAHRFANRQWAGVMYNFQRLQFQPGDRTNVQRLPLFYALSLGSHAMLSAWAGLEYSSTPQGVPAIAPAASASRSRWAGMGGGDFTWESNRTGFRAGYLQQTTDGGGLAEAVLLKEFRAEVRRRLSTRLTLTADATRGQNDPLYPSSRISPYLAWTGGGAFEYAFADRWMVRLGYDRQHLDTEKHPPISPTNRNRVLFSLSYSYSRPLGR